MRLMNQRFWRMTLAFSKKAGKPDCECGPYLAYAWSYFEGKAERFIAVLHVPPIDSTLNTVRAAGNPRLGP